MVNNNFPRISFGIIVLNGEPFTKPNLRNIYEFAYEIIIAEGASPTAAHMATSDGHSKDRTWAILKEFKEKEDTDNKVQIITAEDEGHSNGFWAGEKDQQSQAYAKRCTGDFLWQLDIDEFYDKDDIKKIISLLGKTTKDTCFTIAAHNYFLSPQIKQVGSYFNHPCFQGEPWGRFRRIFTWGENYEYYSHRPPTIINSDGAIIHKNNKVDLTSTLGVYMHHYSVFSMSKWIEKLHYYQNQNWEYDRRQSLSREELIKHRNWHKISNQYKTINTLVLASDSIEIIENIYRDFADIETKLTVDALLKEFKKVSYFKKLLFNFISAFDTFVRNLWHPIRKIISKTIMISELFMVNLGLQNKINEFRLSSNKKS